MKAARRSVAFVSGLLLYSFCVGVAVKYANTGLPRQIYMQLGGRSSLAVMLGEAVAVALLLFLVAAGWGYLTLRPSRRRHRPYVAWMLSGVGVAWAAWLIFGAFNFALKPRAYAAPLQSMLLSSNAAPLFGALNIFGVVGGVWVAGRLAKRRQLSLPSSRARPTGDDAPVTESGRDSEPSLLASRSTMPPH